MINALDFLNSKDIRQYWQEINYHPSAAETAWLIWQSHNHTMSEKHQAWQQLISETDDDENFLSPSYTLLSEECGITSLHAFLREYIRVEDDLADQFFNNEPCCYIISSIEFSDGSYKNYHDMVYGTWTSFTEAMNSFDSDKTKTVCVTSYGIGDVSDYETAEISAQLKPDMTVMRISSSKTYRHDFALLHAFRGMWFNFPVPFKKGDLVTNLYSDEIDYDNGHVPAVIIKTMNDRVNEPNKLGIGGNDDFYAIAYHVDASGKLESDRFTELMDCEYYTGFLTGNQRQLKTISSFLKGEIDELLMIRAIRKIIAESALDAICNEYSYYSYSEDEYSLAGIDDEW